MNWITSATYALVCWGFFTQIATAQQPTTQASAASAPADDLSSLSLEDLMNVEVTSVSKEKQSIADAPAAVTVISQDDIARSGFSTIPDLLRLVPGMDVGHVNSSDWAISARGLNGQFADKLLVLQDGRTLYTPLFAGVYWDSVDYLLPDLDRIEVIRGPGATLWGANAVNGVVNITSKDAQETQGFLLDTRGSINGEDNLGVRYGGQLDKDTYYRVYGKARYFNEFDVADGAGAGDDWESAKGGFRIDRHASDSDTFTLQSDVGSDHQRAVEVAPSFVPPLVQDYRLKTLEADGNILGRWNHTVDDNSDFSLQAYYDYIHLEDDYNYNQNTLDLDFHDHIKVGASNDVNWGLGYRFINGSVSPGEFITFAPSKDDSVYSAFLQDTITVVPEKWFLTLGSKLEHNDYTGFEVEPNARLMWTPDKTNTFWGAISRAVRTPSRLEHDLDYVYQRFQQPVGGGATIPAQIEAFGDDNFKSEELVAYELGYRVQPIKQVSFDVATFYNNYNRLDTNETQAPAPGVPLVIPLLAANKVHGDTWGGEIGSTFEVTPQWHLAGSYSLLQAVFTDDPGSTDTFNVVHYRGAAPENQFQIHSYLDVTKNVQFNSSLYYVGHVADGDIPSYFSADLNVTWQVSEAMTVQVGVLNLLDNHHPEYQGFADTTSSETPRTVYAELTYKF